MTRHFHFMYTILTIVDAFTTAEVAALDDARVKRNVEHESGWLDGFSAVIGSVF